MPLGSFVKLAISAPAKSSGADDRNDPRTLIVWTVSLTARSFAPIVESLHRGIAVVNRALCDAELGSLYFGSACRTSQDARKCSIIHLAVAHGYRSPAIVGQSNSFIRGVVEGGGRLREQRVPTT